MANKARGETTITVPGIGSLILCLTLAGMAALEDAFEVEDIQLAMAKIGTSPSSRNIATIIHALLLGGPDAGKFTVDEIRAWPITPAGVKEALAAMSAGADDDEASAGNVDQDRGKVGGQ